MPQVVTELDLDLAKLKLKSEQIRLEFRQMQKSAAETKLGEKLFGDMKGLLAGVGIGGAVAAIRGVFSGLDDLADLSLKLNETPETLQRVGAVAEMSGAKVETLADAMLGLERGLGDEGNSKAREALARYGFTAEQILALPLEQKIIALADAFQQARAEGHGLADIQAMMGRNAGELIPLLSQGGDELRSLFADVRVVSDASVQDMARINDEFEMVMGNLANFGKEYVAFYSQKFQEWGARIKGIWDSDAEGEFIRDRIARADELRAKKQRMAEMRQTMAAAAKSSDPFAVLDDRRAKDEQAAQERIAMLKKEIEGNRIAVLPDDEKIAALEGKLREATGRLQDAVVNPFTDSLADLFADVGRMADDDPRLERALQSVKEMQEIQRQLTAARDGATRGQPAASASSQSVFSPAGDAARQYDWLYGNPSQLIESRGLDENTRATRELKAEVRHLREKLNNINTVPSFGA